MLVSIILNLNMTGGGTTQAVASHQYIAPNKVEAGSHSRRHDEEKMLREHLLREDKEILLFVETILRECQ